MTRSLILAFAACAVLVSCGAESLPAVPSISGGTTVQMNSNNGLAVKNRLTVGVQF